MKTKTSLLIFSSIFTWIAISSFSSNNPSEMSKLMKQMLQFIQTEKTNVTEGKPAQPFPSQFAKIETAKLTKGKKPSTDHSKYLQGFQAGLITYYKNVQTADRKEKFNLLVNSCITCHQRECPGPVMVIEKNILN